ncbi:MAG: hypothetical protein IPN19_12915 [Elusimicrobia bacterium]|nr:hypothetical protein [Elusimicrobiota bacterium]
MSEITKRCAYCHSAYRPDPRTARFQKSCSAPACRRKRKQEAQSWYLQKNPDYFRGRYGQVKVWLAAHPGYLKAYRASHPEHLVKKRLQDRRRRQRMKGARADIQDTMLRRKVRALKDLRGADIQDTIRRRLDGLLTVLGGGPRADIQVQSAFSAAAP